MIFYSDKTVTHNSPWPCTHTQAQCKPLYIQRMQHNSDSWGKLPVIQFLDACDIWHGTCNVYVGCTRKRRLLIDQHYCCFTIPELTKSAILYLKIKKELLIYIFPNISHCSCFLYSNNEMDVYNAWAVSDTSLFSVSNNLSMPRTIFQAYNFKWFLYLLVEFKPAITDFLGHLGTVDASWLPGLISTIQVWAPNLQNVREGWVATQSSWDKSRKWGKKTNALKVVGLVIVPTYHQWFVDIDMRPSSFLTFICTC